jgi:hypothetical protein
MPHDPATHIPIDLIANPPVNAGHDERRRGSCLVAHQENTRMPESSPADLPPANRFRELARLLAAGLLRLRHPVLPSAPQKFGESDLTALALPPHPSVTVHAG